MEIVGAFACSHAGLINVLTHAQDCSAPKMWCAN